MRWTSVDVSDGGAVAEAASSLDELDAAVNCAAIATLDAILDIDPEDWNRTLAINLTGSLNVARSTYEPLRQAGGVLMLVGSVNAKQHDDTSWRLQRLQGGRRLADPDDRRRVGARRSRHPRALRVARAHRTAQATMRIESGAIDEAKLLGRVPLNRWIDPAEVAAAIVSLTSAELLRPARREHHDRRRLRRMGRPLLMSAATYPDLAAGWWSSPAPPAASGAPSPSGSPSRAASSSSTTCRRSDKDTVDDCTRAGPRRALPWVADVGDAEGGAGDDRRCRRDGSAASTSSSRTPAINPVAGLLDLDHDTWSRVQHVNMWGLFHCGQPAAAAMATGRRARSS